MGERTSVDLILMNEVIPLLDRLPVKREFNYSGMTTGQQHTVFHFYEVNYGELEVADTLQCHGIPCCFHWDHGDSYGAGTKYLSFSPEGKRLVKEVYKAEKSIPVEDLLKRIDDHTALKALILTHKENIEPLEITPKQIDYGNIFLTKRLLDPEWDE